LVVEIPLIYQGYKPKSHDLQGFCTTNQPNGESLGFGISEAASTSSIGWFDLFRATKNSGDGRSVVLEHHLEKALFTKQSHR